MIAALLAAAGAWTAATGLRRLREDLPPGLASDVLGSAEGAARVAAAIGLGFAAMRWMPPEWVTPYAGIAVAFAVGWSVRDLLPDGVAWVVLLAQGRVRPGRRVEGPGFAGRVVRLGWFSVALEDRPGERTSVPNRQLLGTTVTVSERGTTPVELVVPLPGLDPQRARQALREAVSLAPWTAPDPLLEIGLDPARPDTWRVRVHVVEPRFVAPFFGSFSERVREVVEADSTRAGPPE